MPTPHRVLIVGGGFGGLYAAKALKRAPVEVTLVDRANHHLFQPLLYQVATGILTEGEIAPPLRGVLRRQANARVLLAEVGKFDLDGRRVHATTPDGEPLTLGYDSLIVAAGASGGMKTLADARDVRSRVLRAFELAELATDPQERAAWLRVPARTVIWAAGVHASPLAEALAGESGGELDRQGRIAVEDDLTLPGYPEVFAIGDMARLDGVPGVAPAAMQEGRHAARTIRRRLADRSPPRPFRYVDKGQLAVIGRRRALGSAFGIRFAGRIALLIWAVVHVRYLIGWGNRLVTVTRWLWTMLARDRGQRVISPTPLTDLSKTVRTTEPVTI